MALTHKAKVRAAKAMRSKDDIFPGSRLFEIYAWRLRRWNIAQRVKRREAREKYYAEVRKGLREPSQKISQAMERVK